MFYVKKIKNLIGRLQICIIVNIIIIILQARRQISTHIDNTVVFKVETQNVGCRLCFKCLLPNSKMEAEL